MKRPILGCFAILFIAFTSLNAQPATAILEEAQLQFKQGVDFFEKGLYGLSERSFKAFQQYTLPVNEAKYSYLQTQSELYIARCAVRSGDADGERLMLDFVRRHAPEPVAGGALIEIGNYYYNAGKFDKAAEYFKMVDSGGMTQAQRNEVKFKLGYGEFVQKRFSQAKGYFRMVKDSEGEYSAAANYYYGMCCFFDGAYEEAIKAFEKCRSSRQYSGLVPYYITQIYFAQNKFDKLIDYAEPKLNDGNLRNTKEMGQLVGQAYFEKGDFKKALPYLEAYASSSGSLKAEETYQLAYSLYKNNRIANAISNFNQLSAENNKMGQNAMFLLGDCYIKTNNKMQARTAFGTASRMTFDKDIQEDALFNYGKLSAELDYDREAANALAKIPAKSKNYNEAQNILSQVFLNTRDYDKALEVLEKFPDRSPKMNETLQKVTYLKGVQLLNSNKAEDAAAMFKKSLLYPIDPQTKALCNYWLGELAHQRKDYDGSIKLVNTYMQIAKGLTTMPEEASIHTANYLQGYNFLKQQNFASAKGYFQEAVSGIKRNLLTIEDKYVKVQVLGDAVLRAGDCNFKQNKYDEALKFYDEAIKGKYSGYVYALYQKAIIEGLKGNVEDKLIALEKLSKDYPNSDFADDALLETGSTYLDLNELVKAVKPLKTLVNDYKNKSTLINQGLLKLGLVSYNQGNLPAAIGYYKQIFSSNPDADEAKAAMAALEEIYVRDLGKPDDYFAFVETVPGFKVSNISRDSISFKSAEAQFENGNYDKAVGSYSDYLTKFPNGSNAILAYYRRAESSVILKKYDNAFKDYESVIVKGNSKYYTKSLEKAALIAYNYNKNFGKAYEYYSRLEKEPVDENTKFEAQLGAMRSAYRSSNMKAVLEMAEKVAKNPQSTQDQIATAEFYIGKSAFDGKDYDKALNSLNKVVRNSDNEQTAEARYLIAYIYYQKRDLEIANNLCDQAAKESAQYEYWVAKSILLQSDIAAEQGDFVSAKAALEAVIENFNKDPELVKIAQEKLDALDGKTKPSQKVSPNKPANNLLEMDNEKN